MYKTVQCVKIQFMLSFINYELFDLTYNSKSELVIVIYLVLEDDFF